MSDHSDDSSSPIPESTYAALKPPGEFKSQIPSHLLVDATPQDQHILHTLSIGAQYSEWLVNAALETHSQVRRTNGRLLRAEADIAQLKDDKRSFISGWRAIAALAGIISGVVSFFVLLYQALNGAGH